MRIPPSLLIFLSLTCLATVVRAQPVAAPAEKAPAPEPTPADRDFREVYRIRQALPADQELLKKDPRAYYRMLADRRQRYYEGMLAFCAKYPEDRRRGIFITVVASERPLFITGFSADFDTNPGLSNLIEDQAAVAAFKAEHTRRIREFLAVTDPRDGQYGRAYWALFKGAQEAFGADKTPANKAAYLAVMDEIIAKIPLGVRGLVKPHLEFLEANGLAAEREAFLAKLDGIDDADLRQMVAELRGSFTRFDGLAEMKFTAADGREVDHAKLRGKVVLVDFWATWCGPSVDELPNVLANYHHYRDRGFEVIGIALERPGAKPTDTPAEAAAKTAAAKRKMLDYATATKLPWPQYFDPEFTTTTKYGIKSIPFTVLIDRAGKVVAIDATGEKLEPLLRKHLGAAAVAAAPQLKWMDDLEAGRALAARENRPLLVNFTGTEWCPFCITLEQEVLNTLAFAEFAKNHVLVRLEYPAGQARTPANIAKTPGLEKLLDLKERHKIDGFPTMIVMKPDGTEANRAVGYGGGGPKAYLPQLQAKK